MRTRAGGLGLMRQEHRARVDTCLLSRADPGVTNTVAGLVSTLAAWGPMWSPPGRMLLREYPGAAEWVTTAGGQMSWAPRFCGSPTSKGTDF